MRLQSCTAQRKGAPSREGSHSAAQSPAWNQQPAPIHHVGLRNRAGTLCFMFHTPWSASTNPDSSTSVESGAGDAHKFIMKQNVILKASGDFFAVLEFLSPQVFHFPQLEIEIGEILIPLFLTTEALSSISCSAPANWETAEEADPSGGLKQLFLFCAPASSQERLEEWRRVSHHRVGQVHAKGPACPATLRWRQGSPQAEPGTSTPRPRHRFVIASRSGRAAAGAGHCPRRLPLPPELPAGGSLGTGRCRSDPQGQGRQNDPQEHLCTPTPCRSRRQSPFKGPFAAPWIREPFRTDGERPGSRARGFASAAAGGLHPPALGQSRGWAVTAETPPASLRWA